MAFDGVGSVPFHDSLIAPASNVRPIWIELSRALRHALPWFGLKVGAESLAWKTTRLLVAVAVLACLVLLGSR